jgi:signal transduction histidine kinase
MVMRVIGDLVGNAIKFTPESGRVSVRVMATGAGTRVEVQDTGPGIAPEYHARILEKFGQLEEDGQRKKLSTGLGLTFCKMAVGAHGRRIGVESTVGEGSTFWFELP